MTSSDHIVSRFFWHILLTNFCFVQLIFPQVASPICFQLVPQECTLVGLASQPGAYIRWWWVLVGILTFIMLKRLSWVFGLMTHEVGYFLTEVNTSCSRGVWEHSECLFNVKNCRPLTNTCPARHIQFSGHDPLLTTTCSLFLKNFWTFSYHMNYSSYSCVSDLIYSCLTDEVYLWEGC